MVGLQGGVMNENEQDEPIKELPCSPLAMITEGLMRDRSSILECRDGMNKQWREFDTFCDRYNEEIAALDVRIDLITHALLKSLIAN